MFSQDDIDAVLNAAQSAVDALADETDGLASNAGNAAPSYAASSGAAVAVAPPPPAPPRPTPASQTRIARKPDPSRLKRILKLKVPVVVRLAERKMLLSEILKVVPGTILEFSRTVDEELDLMVNNHQIGTGVAVKISEHFGLRVTYVGDLRQRIESLGG